MSKLITTSKYLNYPINTTYQLKQSNMKEIYLALVHARDMLNRPIALRYTLGLDNDHSFDIKKLTRKIKSLFEDTGYSFIYSFEYAERQKGLHLEMILVVDQTIYNPIQIFNLLRKLFFNLDGVTINIESEYKKVSFNFHERKEEYLSVIGGSKVGHNLKDEAQFKDCIYRASYLAKQNDKALVQYKKTFGTVTG
ncbi:hypothetical protein F909_00149 [Acinetobacter sp. ANC 3929]|jgi:hypothetical protein|nr:hypothetical protein [Acinetobacter sp. ANC 3929]ENW84601.1 hypothetical protein F909_00149 [Acinetobacter sp. ANC 3929]KEC82422.1 hypothetical protein DT74_02885 [Acinetobacter sp. ETR1]